MRRTRKLIAAVTAATLAVTPITAFAADPAQESGTGSGIIESDNSIAPDYYSVTLPSINASTYNFTLDPEGLLATYDSANYEAGQTLYFNSTKTAAKIEPASSSEKLYYITQGESDTSKLKAKLTASGNAITTIDGNFYVWTPVKNSQTSAGEYTKLTTTNIATYFDIEYDTDGITIKSVTAKRDHLAGSAVFDGNVYTDTYEELEADADPADYGTITPGVSGAADTFKVTAKKLYKSADATTYNEAGDSDIKFTPAVVNYNNKSDKVTITNNSTHDTTVTAEITVNNVTDLTFATTSSFTVGDGAENLYLAITDGGANTEVVAVDPATSTATAKLEIELAGVNEDGAIKYQTADTDPKTGGHVYKKYEAVGTTDNYQSTSFYITGAANKLGAGWEDYIAGITEASNRPSIGVVYSIAKKETVVPATDDYVMTGNPTDGISYTFIDAPEGAITALKVDGVAKDGAISAGNVTYSDGVLTFNATAVSGTGLIPSGSHTVIATIGDEDYTLTYTTNYYMMTGNPDDGISYTFESAPEGAITSLKVDGVVKDGAISAGNVTYSGGVLTFNTAAANGTGLAAIGISVHTVIATIGGVEYYLTYLPL